MRLALDRVGVAVPELPRAKGTFRQTKVPYREYYDDETREMVRDWYAREIELLDYAF